MKGETTLLVLAAFLTVGHSYLVLEEKAYVQLKDGTGQITINASTTNSLGFDYQHQILYVTAKEPSRLTTFTLASDGTPTLLNEVTFDTNIKGMPLDVEFCRPSTSGLPRVAITFQDPSSASAPGTVSVYHAITPLDTDLRLIQNMAVGPEPVDVKFAADCSVMVVANRGRPTIEESTYRDPEGTITKIQLPDNFDENSGYLSTTISFDAIFTGPGSDEFIELLSEMNFRRNPKRDANNGILSVMQTLEPTNLAIAPSSRLAYVTLPKNNAIARLNLDTNQVSTVYAMGNRSWTSYYMDASDTDREVNMRGYKIHTFLQPTDITWVSKGGSDWLVMLDTGVMSDEPAHGYRDFQRAKTLVENGDIDTTDDELRAQLLDDNELGRLWVSTEDGKRADGKIEHVMAFGGRGFSIHDGNDFRTVSGVVDNIEQVTKQFYRSVFNTAFLTPGSTPMLDAEATSPSFGPNLGALAVGDFDGKTVMFFGSSTSGMVYVYQLSPDVECPQPVFHSVHRAGSRSLTWGQAFNQQDIGDIGITDMKYLSDPNMAPVLAVVSATSNSLSIYSVVDGPFNPNRS